MLRSFSWERRHPAGLPPEMVALPVRNISYCLTDLVSYYPIIPSWEANLTLLLWFMGIVLVAERLGKWWLVVRFFARPRPQQPRTLERISILQPILSGDPTMPACLAHNVAVMARLAP
jgi:hypothetical protein